MVSGRLRSLGPEASHNLLPNTSADGSRTGPRLGGGDKNRWIQRDIEAHGLREEKSVLLLSLGVSLEMRVGYDAATFNTSHHPSLVFFFRDAIGDQAAMGTGAGRT